MSSHLTNCYSHQILINRDFSQKIFKRHSNTKF